MHIITAICEHQLRQHNIIIVLLSSSANKSTYSLLMCSFSDLHDVVQQHYGLKLDYKPPLIYATQWSQVLNSQQLGYSQSPTVRDLNRYGLYLRQINEQNRQNYSINQLVSDVIKGLLFQWNRANQQRKVQDLHLGNRYHDNKNFCLHVKMILALSFVPYADIAEAFELLVASCPRKADPIIDYWEDNYIG